MAGFLFTGTARNEIHQEFYAEIDIEDGWEIMPSWKSMEELLNDQYGTLSTLSRPAMGVYTANTTVRAYPLFQNRTSSRVSARTATRKSRNQSRTPPRSAKRTCWAIKSSPSTCMSVEDCV